MTGFIGGVRSVVLEGIVQAGAIERLKHRKNRVCSTVCDFLPICLHNGNVCAHLSVHCVHHDYVCANKLSSVLGGKTSHSGRFVYPGWADVKTQSALSGQTKHTHLGEIKQKLSWPRLSFHSPSTLCLSMPSSLRHNVFRNVALPQPLRLCNAFCYTTPISLIHNVFEYATSPQTLCLKNATLCLSGSITVTCWRAQATSLFV